MQIRVLILGVAATLCAWAADVTGTWQAAAEGPMGHMERTFELKQDGTKVTGQTTSSMFGKSEINDGTIAGDELTFTIVVKYEGNEMKLNYKGKVENDQIRFTVAVPGTDQNLEWIAKRAK